MVATGLAAEKLVQDYVKALGKAKAAWATSSPQERLRALLDPANTLLGPIGVPRVVGVIDPLGNMAGSANHANFGRGTWTMWFNPDILDANITDPEFWRRAGIVYHEARHAEQTYRVARKLARDGNPADKIATMIGIPASVASKVSGSPLAPATQEWKEAEGWQLNMQAGDDGLSRADLVNTQKDAAIAKYEEARFVRRSLESVMKGDPDAPENLKKVYADAMSKPDGAARMKELLETWQNNHMVAREKAKQWYLAYAKMPVEQDAWSTGGLVEANAGFTPSTPEQELKNLDADERVMIPIAVMRLLGGSQQERDLIVALGSAL